MRVRRAALLRAAVAATLAALLAALPAAATPAPPGSAVASEGPKVRLVRQSPWVVPGGDASLVLSVANPPTSAAELLVTVHQRVRSRAELTRSFDRDQLRGAVVGQLPGGAAPLAELPTDEDGNLVVILPTATAGQSTEGGRRIRLTQPGIYPVQVELRDQPTGDTVDAFVTHLLVGDGAGAPLDVAVVAPVTAPPATTADGARPVAPDWASPLAATIEVLRATPTAVTVMATGETAAALVAARPEAAAALGNLMRTHTAVVGPYVPVDAAVLDERAGAEVRAHLEQSRIRLESVAGAPVDASTWVATAPLGADNAARLADAGIRHVVLGPDAVTPPSAGATALEPLEVSLPGGRRVTALVVDPRVAAHLPLDLAPADQPLAAQHLVAELAGIAMLPAEAGGRPPSADARPVTTVVLPRRLPAPAWIAALLAGVAASPDLRLVPLPDALERPAAPASPPPPPTVPGRRRTRTPPPLPGWSLASPRVPPLADRIEATRDRVATWRSVFGGVDEHQGVSMHERVLVAQSDDLPRAEQEYRLDHVRATVEADLGKLTLPPATSLRLAGRTGELPVSIVNESGRRARVVVQISSEKLRYPEGDEQEIEVEGRGEPARFRVTVRAAGSFPVKVRLLSADRRMTLAETEIRLRANTVPGIGIAMAGAAGGVLGFWWLRTVLFPRGAHLARRRRRAGPS